MYYVTDHFEKVNKWLRRGMKEYHRDDRTYLRWQHHASFNWHTHTCRMICACVGYLSPSTQHQHKTRVLASKYAVMCLRKWGLYCHLSHKVFSFMVSNTHLLAPCKCQVLYFTYGFWSVRTWFGCQISMCQYYLAPFFMMDPYCSTRVYCLTWM